MFHNLLKLQEFECYVCRPKPQSSPEFKSYVLYSKGPSSQAQSFVHIQDEMSMILVFRRIFAQKNHLGPPGSQPAKYSDGI